MEPLEDVESGRFRPIRELGRGAMGVVHLVHDTVRDQRVALKRFALHGGSAKFKQEFRLLARLAHPNLVRVYELVSDGGGLSFSMEPIEGQPLDQYVRGRDVHAALVHLLPQLVEALAFIHSHGVVHRDLKPSNVMITSSGVAKVLDFGVSGLAAACSSSESVIAGTPGFMAPEQIRGGPPETASDLYALGCIVFELIAGKPVFSGPRHRMLQAHASEPAPRLSQTVPDVSPLFDELCAGLLAKDPSERPTAHDLLDRLVRPLSAGIHRPRLYPATQLIGRDTLLATQLTGLRAADEFSILTLSGPSGVGKTAILDRLCGELEGDDWLVLRGGARPEERVPYNALDGAVDQLAARLALREAADPGLRRDAIAARALFPALSTTGCAAASQVKEHVRFRLFGESSPTSRPSAFDALTRLMKSAADPSGIVLLALDDFHWADDDSLALLKHLEGSPWLRVVLAVRDDVPETAAVRFARHNRRAVQVEVPRLAASALREIVERTALAGGGAPTAEEVASAVDACDGRPYLAEVQGRALTEDGAEPRDVVTRLTETQRSLLAFLVAADGWTDAAILAGLVGVTAPALERDLAQLTRQGLVRSGARASAGALVDLYHDGVRRVMTQALQGDLSDAHAHWAECLKNDRGASTARIVRHLAASGQRTAAAAHAPRAAADAEKHGAFGLAAEMYAIALEHPTASFRKLRERRARALERVGRHREAAAEWERLSTEVDEASRFEVVLARAHALIAAGEVDAGTDELDAELRRRGEPPTHARGVRSLASVATFVLGPQGRLVRRLISPMAGRRRRGFEAAARDVQLGILLAFLDPIDGVRYLLRARDAFAANGAVNEVAECEAMFAVLATIGSRAPRVGVAERYERSARALLGPRPWPEGAASMLAFVDGLRALRRGNWAEARERLDTAEAGFERAGRVTERLMSRSWRTMPDVYGQRVPALSEHVSWFRNRLNEQGGDLIVAHVELLESYARYVKGEFDECREAVTRIVNLFDTKRANVQRAGALLYRHMADVYDDARTDALIEFRHAERAARQFRLYETTYAGAFAMVGGLLEASALRRGDRRADPRRLAWYAARMDEAPPLMAGAQHRIRAYAADARGEVEVAVAHLRLAEREARRFDRRVDAAIASFQLGLRLGGDAGRGRQTAAETEIVEAGAAEALLDEDAGLR